MYLTKPYLAFTRKMASTVMPYNSISCPKILKHHKFLWFHWTTEGNHDLELIDLSIWGHPDWHNWEITVKCKVCGASIRRFGIEETEIIRAGIELPK